ncbi:MAG TPA: mechanosensitive ion channel family protein [Candidatus Peregrinibacteria bacterium]|nr:mechanosensitive ion channel family protein [Candidatus Peregrinibacteria bacterium]
MDYQEIFQIVFWGNTVEQYLYALLLFLLTFSVLKFFAGFALSKLEIIAQKTKTDIDDMLVSAVMKIRWPLYFSLALYVSTNILALHGLVQKVVWYLLIILLTFEGIRFLQSIVEYGAEKAVSNKKDKATVEIISSIIRILLWAIAVILILANLGYNVSSLIAGLGIGGIAIALAIQNILKDIFTAFSIYLDKPFQIGDFIAVGDISGTVKKIGLKSTRIESLSGEEIIISNNTLTSSKIHNYKKMKKRRIAFTLGLAYETKTTSLKQIPKIAKEIFAKIKLTELSRIHFKEFGDFSLNFEVVYFVDSNEYDKYMDIQQKVNLAFKSAFEKKGIEFAYPTQTVFVRKTE